MRPLRSHGLLSDGRSRGRRPRPFIVVGGLVAVAIVGYLVATWEGEPEKEPEARRIDRLETPTWRSAELNRPTLPGLHGGEDDTDADTELIIEEDTGDPLHLIGRVQRNQTLFVTLRNRGLMPDRIQPVVDAMTTVFDFRRSRPGDRYEARLDLDGNILEFQYQTSPEDIFVARLLGDQYVAEKVDVPREIRVARIEGKLTTSLFQAFSALGEKTEAAQRFMDLFAFDFDFGTDSRQGDRFRLLIEKIYLDGEFYKYGRVLGAEYLTSARDSAFEAFWFDADGEAEPGAEGNKDGEYFDAEGYALRRMFLISPVRGAKMTSPFGPRFHPILKRWRPHQGVDWAAPTGTPIMASADGVIEFVGWKGGNGNLVVIKHSDTYASVYAHMHRFARGMKKGKEVKQKDVIGYVGSTGLSTAPHLHYGIKKHGKYIDPLTIDTSRGEQLPRRALARFESERDRLRAMLDGSLPVDPPRTTGGAPSPPTAAADDDSASQPSTP